MFDDPRCYDDIPAGRLMLRILMLYFFCFWPSLAGKLTGRRYFVSGYGRSISLWCSIREQFSSLSGVRASFEDVVVRGMSFEREPVEAAEPNETLSGLQCQCRFCQCMW